ncbi:UNVERIFIED_CONTAM: Retrovirus-related Pol polyprotein from type-2 retrotransposable element R2DM [Sesamum radiatum]|uniref:Retrovirus-related Pol polyprotein from type-2 retrotransposable element R2DM n=1 Tax=Sesamum radiatum TaxID=300843 RepID=A0AAW2IK34_SESRA
MLTVIPIAAVCRLILGQGCMAREILDHLISPSQNAFVPGRLISDNVLLAQELFSGYNQCRLPPRCALKVDLRKAYDTVEWDFLFATLRMFGFPAVFIGWIKECVTSAHYSVVVNGGVHGFFAGARGLRQGDPMSPYLFVLVMEVLHMILQQFIEQDGEFRYHWRCQDMNLFQLSFADDLLLFCKADMRSVNLFCRGLDLFATLSGLQTNPQKSQLIISKAASGLRESLLAALGFQEGHLPVRYLGLPLISARLSVQIANHCFRRLTAVLKGGKESSCPLLEEYLSSGYPKVAWETVCRPIEEGGLGIKDILALNRALMSKHLWAVIKQDRTSIWVDWIIQVRLRDCSIWTVKDNKGAWGWRKMLSLRHTLMSHIHYRVGRGDSISLWHDPWHPLGPLITRFPRGPQMTRIGILDKLSIVIKEGQWNWPLITDIACVEITHVLPLFRRARTKLVGRQRMAPLTPPELMKSSTHRVPRFSGPPSCWAHSKFRRTALFFGLLLWGDCLH